MIGLVILVLMVAAFTSGYRLHARRSVNYKQRWQEALALYEDERTKTLGGLSEQEGRAIMPASVGPKDSTIVIQANAYKTEKPDATQLKVIHKMDDYQRYNAEGARLDNELGVIDDLQGMGGFYVGQMLKRRARYGIG